MIKINGQPSIYLMDLQGNEYPAIAVVNRTRRVNGQREISLSFLYDEINSSFINDIEFYWKINFEGEWYTITTPIYQLDGDKFSVGVDAVLSFFVDMNGHYLQDEAEDMSMTPPNYFYELFQGTGYNFVMVNNLRANTLNYQPNETKTSRFLYGINRFKGEYSIRGKQAFIYDRVGLDKNVILHEDLNIENVSVQVNASAFHTFARGFGDKDESEKEGDYKLKVMYQSPLVDKYGFIEGPAIRDGSFKDRDALAKALELQVENSYKVSTTVTAVDLTNNGYGEMKLEEGDRVYLYVERLKLNTQVRVVEINELFDWEGNLMSVQYTLGNESIAESYKNQQYNTLKDFSDIINGDKSLNYDWLPDAVRRASDIINGNLDSHFIYGPGEIIGINKSNPNGYMRFNTDGLGFSRDGGVTYGVAATYEGIVADYVTSGALRTNNVTIIGEDNFFYWDGGKLMAINPNDTSQKVELSSKGLNIEGGAITIKRPDGAVTIDNGIDVFEHSVQASDPPFRSAAVNTNDSRPGYPNSVYGCSTNSTSWENFNFYTFKHTSRYLKFRIAYGVGDGGEGWLRISKSSNNVLWEISHNVGMGDFGSSSKVITIDLGTPTFDQMSVYFLMATGNSAQYAYLRVLNHWLEG